MRLSPSACRYAVILPQRERKSLSNGIWSGPFTPLPSNPDEFWNPELELHMDHDLQMHRLTKQLEAALRTMPRWRLSIGLGRRAHPIDDRPNEAQTRYRFECPLERAAMGTVPSAQWRRRGVA